MSSVPGRLEDGRSGLRRFRARPEAWAEVLVLSLMVVFVSLHSLGIGALLPDRVFPQLLFSSAREWHDAVPHIVAIRAQDAEFTGKSRFGDTIYWAAPDGYLEHVERAFPLTLGGRQFKATISTMKALGSQLLASQLPDEEYTINALSKMSLHPLNPFTTYFTYGHLHLYSVGAALEAFGGAGWVKLTPDRAFYMRHPEEIRKVYLVGKWVGLLFGALSLWMFFRLGQVMYDTKTGLIVATFLPFVPAVAVEARSLKPWIYGWFWLALALLCVMKVHNDQRLRWYLLAGVSGGLSAAAGFFVAYPLPVLIVNELALRREMAPLGLRVKRALLAGVAGIAAFVAASPSVIVFFKTFVAYIVSHNRGTSYLEMIVTPAYHVKIISSLTQPLGVGLLLLALGGVGLALVKRTEADRLLLAGIVVYYILFFKAITIRPGHHLIGVIPLLAILAARLVSHLLGEGGAWKRLGVVALILAIVNLGTQSLFYDLLFASRDVRIQAGQWINEHIAPGSSIGSLVGPDGGKVADVPYRYLEYRLVNDADHQFKKILAQLPDYYLLLERRQTLDPFPSCADCLRYYEEGIRFTASVPVLSRLYSNELAPHFVEGVRIFRKRA